MLSLCMIQTASLPYDWGDTPTACQAQAGCGGHSDDSESPATRNTKSPGPALAPAGSQAVSGSCKGLRHAEALQGRRPGGTVGRVHLCWVWVAWKLAGEGCCCGIFVTAVTAHLPTDHPYELTLLVTVDGGDCVTCADFRLLSNLLNAASH